jgi:hypothetical protein
MKKNNSTSKESFVCFYVVFSFPKDLLTVICKWGKYSNMTNLKWKRILFFLRFSLMMEMFFQLSQSLSKRAGMGIVNCKIAKWSNCMNDWWIWLPSWQHRRLNRTAKNLLLQPQFPSSSNQTKSDFYLLVYANKFLLWIFQTSKYCKFFCLELMKIIIFWWIWSIF